jgi:hypothetical protein
MSRTWLALFSMACACETDEPRDPKQDLTSYATGDIDYARLSALNELYRADYGAREEIVKVLCARPTTDVEAFRDCKRAADMNGSMTIEAMQELLAVGEKGCKSLGDYELVCGSGVTEVRNAGIRRTVDLKAEIATRQAAALESDIATTKAEITSLGTACRRVELQRQEADVAASGPDDPALLEKTVARDKAIQDLEAKRDAVAKKTEWMPDARLNATHEIDAMKTACLAPPETVVAPAKPVRRRR